MNDASDISAEPVGFRLRQATVSKTVSFSGAGLHNAGNTTVILSPAPENHGIVFRRNGDDSTRLDANWKYWINTQLCSTLQGSENTRYRTIEHLLAALYASEIDNVLIDVNEEEIPIMDGSARPLLQVLKGAGRSEQQAARNFIKIVKPVSLKDGDAEITIEPYNSFWAEYTLILSEIGTMVWGGDVYPEKFIEEIAAARTFGRLRTAWFAVILARLRLVPILRGASLKNAMLVAKNRIISREPLRYEEELSRHRILDIVGDLMLAGTPILGKVTASRSGHRHNVALLKKIFEDDGNWIYFPQCKAITEENI